MGRSYERLKLLGNITSASRTSGEQACIVSSESRLVVKRGSGSLLAVNPE